MSDTFLREFYQSPEVSYGRTEKEKRDWPGRKTLSNREENSVEAAEAVTSLDTKAVKGQDEYPKYSSFYS